MRKSTSWSLTWPPRAYTAMPPARANGTPVSDSTRATRFIAMSRSSEKPLPLAKVPPFRARVGSSEVPATRVGSSGLTRSGPWRNGHAVGSQLARGVRPFW